MVTAKELDELKENIARKQDEINGLQAELKQLQADFQQKAQRYLAEAGIEAQAPKKLKPRPTSAKSERWNPVSFCQLVKDVGPSISNDALEIKMKKSKPSAKTHNFQKYLDKYTTRSGGKLNLNAEGKKAAAGPNAKS